MSNQLTIEKIKTQMEVEFDIFLQQIIEEFKQLDPISILEVKMQALFTRKELSNE